MGPCSAPVLLEEGDAVLQPSQRRHKGAQIGTRSRPDAALHLHSGPEKLPMCHRTCLLVDSSSAPTLLSPKPVLSGVGAPVENLQENVAGGR